MNVEHLRAIFLGLCEVREIRDEAIRQIDPKRYLRDRVWRLVLGDRARQ